MNRLTPLLFFLLIASFAHGQELTQTIRGQVVDRDTKAPIIGATVVLIDSTQLIGSVTDLNGYYVIEEVPIGRVRVSVSSIGYQSAVANNLELTSGKELVLNFELEESVLELTEVEVTAQKSKAEALNSMTSVSARQLSIEEAQMYAGSLNDVSRMAQNLAGVQGANDTRNDVIIRGNSPTGVLYRLEGMDIPNPNHFATSGTTGGPISVLNSNVLSSFDFLTGAFPAEYGNALAGIFDLRMRNGNTQKHEFIGQLGFNGAEMVAEGPISKERNWSYVGAFRYSTLDLFKAMGIDFGTASIPNFTDFSFKLHFPTKKGATSLFGLGGHSYIEALDSNIDPEDDPNPFDWSGSDIRFKSRLGAVGLGHTHLINSSTYLRVVISTNVLVTGIRRDTLNPIDGEPFKKYENDSHEGKQSVMFYVNKKLSTRHILKAGMYTDRLFFSLSDSVYRKDQYFVLSDFDGATFLFQPYAQWQYRMGDRWTLNTGLHYQYFTLNGSQALEPRLGLRWRQSERNTLSAAYGLHSQNPPTPVFFEQELQPDGSYASPNRDIDFTKSHHFVLGYDRMLRASTRLKLEAYYQSLFNVPVNVNLDSYSLLNQGSNFGIGFPDSLVNAGTGTNYGLEVTVEQFLRKGYYYLLTASIYESKYTGSNGVTYNTAFNGNYTFNFLAGKEWRLNSKKKGGKRSSFNVDLRVSWNGGQRYVPVDVAASREEGEAVFDFEQSYQTRYPDYFRIDLKAGYKRNGKKVTHTVALDFQNVTNRKNIFTREFDVASGQMVDTYQLGFLPILQYRVLF